jgi:Domain of unknown function (DUF5058)
MDWKQIANEPWIWICGGILSAIALYQCTYFMIRALNIMKRYGLQKSDINSIIRGAVITSFGPVMSEIFIMIALVISLSAGLAWQREGAAVGSVFTELVQASNAAVGAGQEFGSKNFNMTGFANVIFVMNVSCVGWLIAAGFFTRYLGTARQKIAGGDARWLSILTVCATLGVFGYWASTNLAKKGGVAVAVIAGAVLAMFFFLLADWIKKPHLKEWALGFAMFGGMIIGKLYAG